MQKRPQIEEVRDLAKAIARKKSWIVKGLQDLLKRMSEYVKDIESDYFVYADTPAKGENDCLSLILDTRADADFHIWEWQGWRGKWNTEVEEEITSSQAKDILLGLEDTLENLVEKLKEIDGKYATAQKRCEEMLKRLMA